MRPRAELALLVRSRRFLPESGDESLVDLFLRPKGLGGTV